MRQRKSIKRAKQRDPWAHLYIISDLLGLVGIDVDASDVSEWTKAQQATASAWAVREHIYANDHRDVRRYKMPKFLERFKT